MATPERSSRRPLAVNALARLTQRLHRAPDAPWLHGEVARRMAERLPVIKLQPATVADWGAFLGASGELLAQTYPLARLLAVEPDTARRDATAQLLARPWWSPQRWRGAAPLAVAAADVGAGQAQLLWSNMGLHFEADPQLAMAAWHRVVGIDGFLMFSTLGPGSLGSLRSLYSAQGCPSLSHRLSTCTTWATC